MATVIENLQTRIANLAAELAGSADGDTNEYVMRRWQELKEAIAAIKDYDTLTATDPGEYEILSIGET